MTVPDIVDVDKRPTRTATEVQDRWGHVAREVQEKGRVAITSRGHADMVMVSRSEYDRLMKAVSRHSAVAEARLAELEQRYLARFAAMADGSMADRIDRLLDLPTDLPDRPRAGEGF